MSDTSLSAAAFYPWVEEGKRTRRTPSRAWHLLPLALVIGFLGTIPYGESITYGIDRLFYTPEELAERQAVQAMFTHIHIFRVACPDPLADQQAWLDYTAKQGWPLYPQAGAACVTPSDRVGYDHVTNFSVACPTTVFSLADQQRWVHLAALNQWAPYTQAGPACVDP